MFCKLSEGLPKGGFSNFVLILLSEMMYNKSWKG